MIRTRTAMEIQKALSSRKRWRDLGGLLASPPGVSDSINPASLYFGNQLAGSSPIDIR